MEFSFEMTMKELVEEMNSGGTQKDLYRLSKIPKDILPFLIQGGWIYIAKNKNMFLKLMRMKTLQSKIYYQLQKNFINKRK